MTRTAWITTGIVAVVIVALIAGASVIVSHFNGSKSPEISAISCRWAGDRVIMSGTLYNPSSSSQTVIITPRLRFEHGPMQNIDAVIDSPKFTSVAAGATFKWSADVTPADARQHLGERIVSCDPTSPDSAIDLQNQANDG